MVESKADKMRIKGKICRNEHEHQGHTISDGSALASMAFSASVYFKPIRPKVAILIVNYILGLCHFMTDMMQ